MTHFPLLLDIDTSNGYYQAVLGIIDRFFDGEIEPQLFEESMRYFFVTDAYLLFTIDKLVHTFVKQVKRERERERCDGKHFTNDLLYQIQAVTVDTDSVELVRLFRSDQELDVTSRRILSVYRLRAEEIVGSEENLYKINFVSSHRLFTAWATHPPPFFFSCSEQENQYDDNPAFR